MEALGRQMWKEMVNVQLRPAGDKHKMLGAIVQLKVGAMETQASYG